MRRRRPRSDHCARDRRGMAEPARKRSRDVGRALSEISNFFVDVAAVGATARREPFPMPREVQAELEERVAELGAEQHRHVYAIISERTALHMDREDAEGAFVDVDFGTLEPATLWKLHAYVYSRLVFGPMLARTHGLRYEGGVFLP